MPRYLSALLAGAGFFCALAATPAHAQVDGRAAIEATQAQAERAATRAHRVSRRVARGLDRARTDRNPIQVQCLDRTLTEVNAVIRMLRDQRRSLPRANGQELRHRRSVFVVLDHRLTDLEAQAITCEGGRGRDEISGVTRVEVWVSPGTPRVDAGHPRPLPARQHLWER